MCIEWYQVSVLSWPSQVINSNIFYRFGYLEYTDDDAAIQSAVKVAEEVGTVVVCVGHGSVSP